MERVQRAFSSHRTLVFKIRLLGYAHELLESFQIFHALAHVIRGHCYAKMRSKGEPPSHSSTIRYNNDPLPCKLSASV
jgi:hypothetical protein